MNMCEKCSSFIPRHIEACPNCACGGSAATNQGKALRRLATAVGASLVSMTLMACYGAPPDFSDIPKREPGNSQGTDNPPPSQGGGQNGAQ